MLSVGKAPDQTVLIRWRTRMRASVLDGEIREEYEDENSALDERGRKK